MTLPDYINSIDYYEVTVTGTSYTVDFEDSQSGADIATCVPFTTIRPDGTSDDWDDILCDVYFNAGTPPTLTIERAPQGGGGTLYTSTFIVEFDGTGVTVESGAYDLTDSETWYWTDLSAVPDRDKTFIVGYNYNSGSNDDWNHAMIKYYWEDFDTDAVYYARTNAVGTISGHFYVVEAQNNEFSVQTGNLDIASVATGGYASINSVDTSKTFVVGSYSCSSAVDRCDAFACTMWLADSTTMKIERAAGIAGYTVDGFAFAVELGGDESVQHFTTHWEDGGATGVETEITAIVEAESIVISPSCFGLMTQDLPGGVGLECSFRQVYFLDSDTVYERRDDNFSREESTGHFNVIHFNEDAAGAPWEDKIIGVSNPAAVIGVKRENIGSVIGVD